MTKEDKQKKDNQEDVPVIETEVEEQVDVVEDDALPDTEKQLKEMENRYLRLMAEYDNFRKRSQREKSKLYEDATIDCVKTLLPLIDSLERSAEQAAEVKGDGKAFAEGIPIMMDLCTDILKKMDVSRIDALGQPFDPELHHAVQQLENDDVESNTVIEELQPGYILGERLIRPSLVVVSA